MIGTDNKKIIFLLEMRMFAYDLLKHTFCQEPSKNFIENLIKEEIMENFPFIEDSQSIGQGINEVSGYFINMSEFQDEEYEKLHWDFTKMFIGPNFLPAPPWESAYLNEDRLLFQEETLEVRKKYLKYYFLPKNYPHEPDDHIGLELDFMYRLSKLTIELAEKQNTEEVIKVLNDQDTFLTEHLLQWIDRFTDDVIYHADTDFYKGMARVLKGYLELDRTIIKDLLGF
ncbi:cytoplasmic chaperone TorD family protein [Alkaliphilus metalliredigens QYMF]|uniref:Cytoplasmic chaperone TorD family protein n=1 Tax=Alkaliphilus metalliredigens (strain QYMF) TaxID=293826 RepID=A6TMW3_ALKMQ|nr:molecular chaperone TorD family protein [Alkaliphilus metalliredigens]ABR47531.1 cytoplasmic chaperone TorD family protein [Alkaliphilus metalliredigens QYMF]